MNTSHYCECLDLPYDLRVEDVSSGIGFPFARFVILVVEGAKGDAGQGFSP